MRTIWKYRLQVADAVKVPMPAGSKVIKVGVQDGELCAWALVSPPSGAEHDGHDIHGTQGEIRYFRIVGTGNPIPENILGLKYLDTVFMGHYVWHVFIVQTAEEVLGELL